MFQNRQTDKQTGPYLGTVPNRRTLVGGVIRTHDSILKFICEMLNAAAIPRMSRSNVRISYQEPCWPDNQFLQLTGTADPWIDGAIPAGYLHNTIEG